jgi:hypothetical protein
VPHPGCARARACTNWVPPHSANTVLLAVPASYWVPPPNTVVPYAVAPSASTDIHRADAEAHVSCIDPGAPSGRLRSANGNAAMTTMPAVPEHAGTENLQPLGVAGLSTQLWLAPPGQKAGMAPTSVSLSDQGLARCLAHTRRRLRSERSGNLHGGKTRHDCSRGFDRSCLSTPGEKKACRNAVAPGDLGNFRARHQCFVRKPRLLIGRPPPPLNAVKNFNPHRSTLGFAPPTTSATCRWRKQLGKAKTGGAPPGPAL